MVTHSLNGQTIRDVARQTGVKAIQIHDDLPIADIIKLRNALPQITLLKAIHVPFAGAGAIEINETIVKSKALEGYVDALLLDSRTKDRLGGTGKVHDWQTSRRIIESVKKLVILAGGITPENVRQSIAETGCYGVDVNSGVEDKMGCKDPRKVKAYCSIAAKELGFLRQDHPIEK